MLAATFFLGGFVKGAAAFGQPMVTVPLASQFLPLHTVIAISVVPVFVGNIVQLFQNRRSIAQAIEFVPFYFALASGIGIGLYLFSRMHSDYLLAVIGVLILTFVVVQITQWRPRIALPMRLTVQVVGGASSGVLAGITSFAAFPSIPMFVACRLERETFAVVLCLMFLIVGTMISLGLSLIGLYAPMDGLAGMLCVLPSVAGQLVGQATRDRLPDHTLRRVVLVLLSVMACSLLLRGLS